MYALPQLTHKRCLPSLPFLPPVPPHTTPRCSRLMSTQAHTNYVPLNYVPLANYVPRTTQMLLAVVIAGESIAAAQQTVLVIGAARGVGYELAKAYAAAKNTVVHATARNIQDVPPISGVRWHTLDVTNPAQLSLISTGFEKSGTSIDLLIHCAGVNAGSAQVQKIAHFVLDLLNSMMPA